MQSYLVRVIYVYRLGHMCVINHNLIYSLKIVFELIWDPKLEKAINFRNILDNMVVYGALLVFYREICVTIQING
jgi:hypothetical protein